MAQASYLGIVSGNETEDTANAAIKRRYKGLQDNLNAQEGAKAQGEQEALNRRFASMGALNSGAAMRNSQLQADMSNRRAGEARNSLYAAQSGEEENANQAMLARNLQRENMRLGSQEALSNRDWSSGENSLNRSFEGKQNELNRDLDWRKTYSSLNLERDKLLESNKQNELARDLDWRKFSSGLNAERDKLLAEEKQRAFENPWTEKVLTQNLDLAMKEFERGDMSLLQQFLGIGGMSKTDQWLNARKIVNPIGAGMGGE